MQRFLSVDFDLAQRRSLTASVKIYFVNQGSSTMWWSTYWWTPWMFFGPLMMVLFAAACVAMMFFMIRSHRHGSEPTPAGSGMTGCCRPGVWLSQGPAATSTITADGNAAFNEYRAETLRRLEQEQAEFQGFLEHLRLAKDKAEFDQFMTERRPNRIVAAEAI
jgi:Protein of unknown function (DUF2852)